MIWKFISVTALALPDTSRKRLDHRVPSHPERLQLGDACAMISPFTGNGMAMAFTDSAPASIPWWRGRAANNPRHTSSVKGAALHRKFRLRLGSAALLPPFLKRPRRRGPCEVSTVHRSRSSTSLICPMYLHALSTALPSSPFTQAECRDILQRSEARSRLNRRAARCRRSKRFCGTTAASPPGIFALSDAVVTCVAVEVCAAVFYLDDDTVVLVSARLWGDGAAGTIWRSRPGQRALACRDFTTVYQPANRDRMQFEIREGELRNLLDTAVPELASAAVTGLLYDERARPDRPMRRAIGG